jgi:hypothetical protein
MNAFGDLRDKLSARLLEIFPAELAGAAVYILTGDEAGPGFLDLGTACIAYTGAALDLKLQPRLEALGRWSGRGFATIFPQFEQYVQQMSSLVSNAVERSSGGHLLPDTFAGDLVERIVWSTTLHEFSHHVEHLLEWHLTAIPGTSQSEWVAEPTDQVYAKFPRNNQPPWLWPGYHGDRFVRAAAHVFHRAARFGIDDEEFAYSFAGDRYGLSPASAYAQALADEVQAHSGEPISLILESPPPEAFQQLWRADVARYHAEHQEAA